MKNVHGKTSQHDVNLLAAAAAKLLNASLQGLPTGDNEQALAEALEPFGYASCEVCESMTTHPYKFDNSQICHHCKAAHYDMERDNETATENYYLDFSDAETTEHAWKFLVENDLEWLGYEVDEHQRIYFSDLNEMDIAARYLEDIEDMNGLRVQVCKAFERDNERKVDFDRDEAAAQAASRLPDGNEAEDLEQTFFDELNQIAKDKGIQPSRYYLNE